MRLLAFACLAASALAAARTSPPSGCLVVSKEGGSGTYATVQAAVNALSTSATAAQCIFIRPGTYMEQVLVTARKARLSIYGYTEDDTSYGSNKVKLIHSASQASTGGNNDGTATLRVKAAGFRLYNVDVENSYGKGSQAVAVSAYADSGYYGCAMKGFQDTLLSNEGKQLYSKSLIQGATDFVFGQRARSWFEKCDIRVVENSIGYITANGRDSDSNVSFYVFNNSSIAAASGHKVANGAYYLGRPWRDHARVVFQHTSMSSVINSAGWKEWSSSSPQTCCVLYGEYGNTGAGAAGTRASFSKKLSAPVQITEILGNDFETAGFFDATYI